MTIAVLSKEETRHIQLLTERRNSLDELILILTDSDENNLLVKAKAELKDVKCDISNWWKDVLLRYNRDITDPIHYNINFFTCELSASED